MFNENMEDKQNGSKKNLPVVRQAFHGKKDYHKLLQPAMLQNTHQTQYQVFLMSWLANDNEFNRGIVTVV